MPNTHYSLNDEPFTRSARWSMRFGIFSLPVILVTIAILRSGKVAVEHAQTALFAGALCAFLAIVLAVVACIVIWIRGWRGTRAALIGMFSGSIALVFPIGFALQQISLPPLYDISTDVGNPPAFDAALKERSADDLDVRRYNQSHALLQLSAYPAVQGADFTMPVEEAFSTVKEQVNGRKWRIISTKEPVNGEDGFVEVFFRSRVLGIESNAVIRIRAREGGSRVDMRSATRQWRHDMGVNARAIESFMADLQHAGRE